MSWLTKETRIENHGWWVCNDKVFIPRPSRTENQQINLGTNKSQMLPESLILLLQLQYARSADKTENSRAWVAICPASHHILLHLHLHLHAPADQGHKCCWSLLYPSILQTRSLSPCYRPHPQEWVVASVRNLRWWCSVCDVVPLYCFRPAEHRCMSLTIHKY